MTKKEKMNKEVCLTFDYELFFGQSGTIDKSLIEPTDRILDILKNSARKAVFFVDASFLLFISDKPNCKLILSKIEDQLARILNDGHRIELHIHPHWVDAIYNECDYTFSFPTYEHYQLSSFTDNDLMNYFLSCYEILIKILRKIDDSYSIIAYRAGGFCIEPFERIASCLLFVGIKIDSSIASGVKITSAGHSVNFSNYNKKKPYKFLVNTNKDCSNGQFIELPITTIRISLIERICNKMKAKIRNDKPFGDGVGMSLHYTLLERVMCNTKMISLDNGQECEKDIKRTSSDSVCVISHPKSFTIKSLDELQKLVLGNTKFITTLDIYSRIN